MAEHHIPGLLLPLVILLELGAGVVIAAHASVAPKAADIGSVTAAANG
jgi:hypothetical protein